eukprot:2036554-Amphidinium_carterae.1
MKVGEGAAIRLIEQETQGDTAATDLEVIVQENVGDNLDNLQVKAEELSEVLASEHSLLMTMSGSNKQALSGTRSGKLSCNVYQHPSSSCNENRPKSPHRAPLPMGSPPIPQESMPALSTKGANMKGKTYLPPPWRKSGSEPSNSQSGKSAPAAKLAPASTTPKSLPAAGCATPQASNPLEEMAGER